MADIARDLYDGARSFTASRAGKLVVAETLLAGGVVVWVAFASVAAPSEGEKASVGLAFVGTVLVVSTTLMHLEYRRIMDYAIVGVVPLGLSVSVIALAHYLANGLALPAGAVSTYADAVFIGAEICVVSGFVGLFLRKVVVDHLRSGPDRTPEERVLGEDIDEFEDV